MAGNLRQKINNFLASHSGKNRVNKKLDDLLTNGGTVESGETVYPIDEVANKFSSVLKNEISNSGLSADAESSIISGINIDVKKVGIASFCITVRISPNDSSRPSLWPDGYPSGVYDIVGLLNEGAVTRDAVYGVWSSHPEYGKIPSRTIIPGAHFIDSAISTFETLYSKKYHVKSISKEIGK